MIIKGKSRGGPKQLATHLLRRDTNERVEILELQSAAPNLAETLRDWQLIAGGTRGKRGLYHANIDPAAHYVMTPDQWEIAVNRLEQELGLDGQPRAVVLHEKNGRQHVHVVWQRTDIDTMTLVSDSHNYRAHERASLALEKEFGHEIVPGKHAKRDREKPPPKAEITHDEWQKAERTGLDPRAFKAMVTALYEHADGGPALKAALEEQGLILAKGDRRDFVIVDGAGEVHSLARQIKGVTAKDLRGFMVGVDPKALPSVDEAKSLQREQAREITPAEPPEPEPIAQERADASADEAQKLADTLAAWHDEDVKKLKDFHDAERARTAEILDREAAGTIAHLDAVQSAARERFERENAAPGGLVGFIGSIRAFISPKWAKNQQKEREHARELFENTLAAAREQQTRQLQAAREAQLADLADRHAQQLRERDANYRSEFARRMGEHDEAQRILAQIEERRRIDEERRREDARQRENMPGPEPPSRAR